MRAGFRRIPLSQSLKRRAAGAILACYALTGASLFGFDVSVHREITERALKRFVGWTDVAVKEVQDANDCIDSGSKLSTPDEFEKPCSPAVGCKPCQFEAPWHHFDNETFQKASDRLIELRNAIRQNLAQRYFVQARKVLGFALHTIQDFYAHSNWVDLGNEKTFRELLNLNPKTWYPPYSMVHPGLSTPDFRIVPLCEPGGFNLTLRARKARSNETPVATPILTSGYFFADDDKDTNHAPDGKCAHGFNLGLEWISNGRWKWIDGIAKDSPAHELHPIAKDLALQHSIEFIKDCLPFSALQNHLGVLGVTTVWGDRLNKLIDVKAGEVYLFEADPNKKGHKVTWGSWMFSLGVNVSSGPDGTPGVRPATYRWYVTPPLPEVNVGALIGSIYDPACPLEGKTLAGNSCPAIVSVPIGSGGRVDIPAMGALYLHVNDGHLSNNEGYFEVSFTALKRAER